MKQYFLLASIGFLLYSTFLFMVGLHNTDSCASKQMMVCTSDPNGTAREISLSGRTWTLPECYLTGISQIIKGFIIAIISATMLGYVIKNEHKRNI